MRGIRHVQPANICGWAEVMSSLGAKQLEYLVTKTKHEKSASKPGWTQACAVLVMQLLCSLASWNARETPDKRGLIR